RLLARRAPIVKAGHSQTSGLVQCTNVMASSAPAARSSASSGISNVRMCRVCEVTSSVHGTLVTFTAKPPANVENWRLCLSVPNERLCEAQSLGRSNRSGTTKEQRALRPRNLVRENGDLRSNQAIIHPRFAAWYK